MHQLQVMIALRRNMLIESIASLFIVLFVYTATDKILNHQKFQIVLAKSPLIDSYSLVVSWAVPFIELLIAALLFMPGKRKDGFVGSFILMSLFTIYIGYMILFASHLPCSCGGVISEMTWNQHLIFNLFFTMLAGAGVWLSKQTKDFIAINRTSRKPV